MKKTLLTLISLTLLITVVSAQNIELIDIVDKPLANPDVATVVSALNDQQSDYQLMQAQSCSQLQDVFVQWAQNTPDYRYPVPYIMEDDVMVSVAEPAADTSVSNTAKSEAVSMDGGDIEM